MTTGLNAETAT